MLNYFSIHRDVSFTLVNKTLLATGGVISLGGAGDVFAARFPMSVLLAQLPWRRNALITQSVLISDLIQILDIVQVSYCIFIIWL